MVSFDSTCNSTSTRLRCSQDLLYPFCKGLVSISARWLVCFLQKYTPRQRENGFISKFSVMAICLLFCKGTMTQKAMIVYEMLVPDYEELAEPEIQKNNV